jgi:hypothetical protein
MHNRTVHQKSFIGLTLGALSMASAVHADPPKPSTPVETPAKQALPAAQPETTPAPADTTNAVSVKNVSLADGAAPAADTGADAAATGVNRPLLRTSAVLFTVPYAITFVTAMAKSKETDGTLYIPVVGPFIELGNDTSAGNKVLLVGSGVLQSVGLIGIVTSFFVPESKTKNWPLLGNHKVTVTPVANRSDYHLVVGGRF